MSGNDIVDVAQGLVLAKPVEPPFCLFVPEGTNLKEQFKDGIDDLGTLEERLLRIKDVKAVRIGTNAGVSITHFEE